MSRTGRKVRPIARPRVAAVEPGSIAAAAGLQSGDQVRAINGHPVRDIVDFQFLTTEAELLLTIDRPGAGPFQVEVEKEPDDPLGVDFGGKATFDGIYTCKNNCIFCFVFQQPRGMRPTLNLMDDDFRLSFLHGNFVTLVGVEPEYWERIISQRLSPLYVSVHATDDSLRAFLMGTAAARGIMGQLAELRDHGIQYHTQVVLCPGINDGEHLNRTITDLTSLGPDALLSLSVVPVGLTRYRDGLYDLRTYTAAEAHTLIDQVEAWQRRLTPEWGFPVVYCSDEWYVLAGRPVPPAEFYGDYDQLENGVGMVRLFLEEQARVEPRLPTALPAPRRVTVATGVLAGPVLAQAVERLNRIDNLRVDLLTVRNEFYGHTVTCAGLLTGRDLLMALADQGGLGDAVVLPAVSFRDGDGRSLDDLTPAQISANLGGTPVHLAGAPADLAAIATDNRLRAGRRRSRPLRFTLGAAEPGYFSVTFGQGRTR